MSAGSRIELVRPSRPRMALFHLYLRWYMGRHFHGLRIANSKRLPREVDGPLIVYLNHPSWWDPLSSIMLSQHFLAKLEHYAPMDEAALERYGFFRKLGLFPVEQETARGASQFLRYATRVASTPNSVLWLTPQGRFADPRVRPLVFKDGMAALLTRLPRVTVVPLAIEYAYWDERLPEVLMNWGEPIRNNGGDIRSKEMWNATITAGLSRAQDELAALAATRDAARFDTLLEGKAGIGLIYDIWRRIRSRYQGKSYDAEHASIRRP